MNNEVLTYFCKSYFENLHNIDVLDHNATSHLGVDKVTNYYIARIKIQDNIITVQVNYEDFNNCSSLHDMCDVIDNKLHTSIFEYNGLTKKDIDDYFNLLGG